MATPMTAAQVTAQLEKWGVAYKPYAPSWATHNRKASGRPWGPVNGFIWHHVGSDGDGRPDIWNGNTALPGPKAHFYIDQTGMVWLMGWGRANHAGGGDPAVLAKVISEEYTGILKPHYGEGDSGAVDGNARFYGVEIGYSGSHGMTPAQYSTALKLSAAILDFHKWSQRSVIAHGEWSSKKWDPGYAPGKMMDMNAVRNDIMDTLKGKAGSKTPANPPKVSTPPNTAAKTYEVKSGDTVKIGNVSLKVM